MFEARLELLQIAIGAIPLLLSIALLAWRPARIGRLYAKVALAVILVGVIFVFLRSTVGDCVAIGTLCNTGETLIRLNPPYWGLGRWNCEECLIAEQVRFALLLNAWRPIAILSFLGAAAVAACVALRQGWQHSRQHRH